MCIIPFRPILGWLESPLLAHLQIDWESLSADPDPRFSAFLEYWARLATAKGAYPGRVDIDPTRFDPRLLSNIFLVDVVRSGERRLRYRYRLLGEEIMECESMHRGDYLDEIAESEISKIEDHYEAAIEGRIFLRQSNLGWLRRHLDFQHYSVLVLPLADDGKVPTHLAGLVLYGRRVPS